MLISKHALANKTLVPKLHLLLPFLFLTQRRSREEAKEGRGREEGRERGREGREQAEFVSMAIGVRDRVLWQAAVALVALVVGVVVADAAAVVEVYRMIQYDLRGVPLGSRRAAMNHHASSNLAVPGSDLSRTVIILPIAEANITMLNGAYALASETSSAGSSKQFFFFFFLLSLSLSLSSWHPF